MNKKEKRKPKYGLFSCVAYIYKLMWKYERSLALTGILTVPVSVIVSAVTLYTPSIVLRYLETEESFSTITLVILGLMLAELMSSLASVVTKEKAGTAEFFMCDRLLLNKIVTTYKRDWYLMYDSKVHELDLRANAAMENNHTKAVHFPMDFAGILSAIIKFVLFGTIVTNINHWIIVLLIVGSIVNFVLSKWVRNYSYSRRDIRNGISKKIGYLSFRIGRDFKFGKEIRIYNFKDYIMQLAKQLLKAGQEEHKKILRVEDVQVMVSFFIIFLRDGLAYVILIAKAVQGEVDAAEFILYFSAITSLAGLISEIMALWSNIAEGAMQISDYREDLEIEGNMNLQQGIALPDKCFSIEFKNVTYKYPQGDKNILENVSFQIKPGEKIALVGINGAGKTTLTRLLCGLLLPDEGEILINGHAIAEYNRDELYSLFGMIPQDYHLLPISIARNISVTNDDEKIDEKRLVECIKAVGLEEKINSLTQGAETLLNRQINPDGVELSGGEIQKLLMARLLYRSPYCMILDEPTAALDPIAEDRMYRKYHELAQNVTSIFISHRLASTSFCDRILLLDGAGIAEEGSHAELMKANGKYAELFKIQSKYYQEGAKQDET